MTGHTCPVCGRDAPHLLDGGWWSLRCCPGHVRAARSVTGVGLRKQPAQGQLFDPDVEAAGI